MKVNSVTWYSKLLAIILFIALPFFGFYLGMKYQEATSTKNGSVVTNNNLGGVKTLKKVETDELTINVVYKDGIISYSGTVRLPTPCYILKDETKVLESSPEQIQIRLSILPPPPNAGVCIQTLTNIEFSGELQASEQAEVSIWLNNKKIE